MNLYGVYFFFFFFYLELMNVQMQFYFGFQNFDALEFGKKEKQYQIISILLNNVPIGMIKY